MATLLAAGIASRAAPAPSDPGSWQVLAGPRCGRMLADYHQRSAAERVAARHTQSPPHAFAASAEGFRQALARTYLMPPPAGVPQAEVVGRLTLSGVPVEKRLLRLREGVYSTALVFRPPDANAGDRRPALLMLPGHGDPSWSPAVQSRCLAFARRGFVVMLVQPFGQNERGENSLWNEGHGSQAMAYLLVTGQSLLGLIMADHQAELTDLCARADVDPGRVGVTGVSMGGTHTQWLAAIDPRVRAAVAVAVAPLARPETSTMHHCLCDTMVGLFQVADEETILSLAAPRALLRITPGVQAPLDDEGTRLYAEGKVSLEEAVRRHALGPEGVRAMHGYAHAVFGIAGVPGNYADEVIPGPHDYTPAMRDVAAHWLARHLRGDAEPASRPEPDPAPLTDRVEAVAALNFWPRGERPPAVLSPTAYVQREVSARMAALAPVPADLAAWRQQRQALQSALTERLGVALASPPAARLERVGQAQAESGVVHRLRVEPEPGIELALLLFEPARGATRDGRLVVLLHPSGKSATAGTEARRELTHAGAWVLCPDLRGMGETRHDGESGAYLGFRDLDIAVAALKLGHTLAGYWVKDLLAAIAGAQAAAGGGLAVTVRGELEAGFVALLAAGLSGGIERVETVGLLASYASPPGYGLPFAYSDADQDKAVRGRPLGGYGSMVPCVPGMLFHADIAQLAALAAPRPLAVADPLWASGDRVSRDEAARAFAWTRAVYRLCQAEEVLTLACGEPTR